MPLGAFGKNQNVSDIDRLRIRGIQGVEGQPFGVVGSVLPAQPNQPNGAHQRVPQCEETGKGPYQEIRCHAEPYPSSPSSTPSM